MLYQIFKLFVEEIITFGSKLLLYAIMYAVSMLYETISQNVFVQNVWYIIVILDKTTITQYLLWFGSAAFGAIVLTSAALLAFNRRNLNSEKLR